MKKEKIIQAFESYVSDYDLKDPNIYLKYIHTGKVAENCENIARSLGLSEEEVFFAWKSGMLHDIGRFEQLKRYHTFNDAISIDHAQFGADILFQEGLLETFGTEGEAELLEIVIRCHSLYRLPEHLTEREVMFCDILRDADKVDIYRANYDTGLHVVYQVTEETLKQSEITKEVYDVFCEERCIPRPIKKTVADHLVGHVALSFELVYPKSRQMAKEQGYLWKLLETEFEHPETIRLINDIRHRIEEWYQNN